MNSSKGYYNTITFNGHKENRSHGTGEAYRFAKKIARRAQRRDGHKEIAEQLQEDWIGLAEDLKPHRGMPNMFSPIPIWLMSEDERLGMEHFRLLQSRRGWFEHVRSWSEDKDQQKILSTCDETLYEDLQRSIKKGK